MQIGTIWRKEQTTVNVEHAGAQQVQLDLWLQHQLITALGEAALNSLQSHQQGFFRHMVCSQKNKPEGSFHHLKERKPSLKRAV